MKKIAIAAALAAFSMVASAQVTISGKVSQWYDRTETGGARVSGVTADPTSNITIKATENLGQGLNARVIIDTQIFANDPTTTGTKLGDRQSTVGIGSKHGSVDLGRNVHSQFVTLSDNDAFGTLYGSVAGDVHNLRGLRFSNGAFVATTLGPIKATYDRSSDAALANEALSYSLGAKLGPISATVARFEQGPLERSDVVAANAKFGATNLFYSHSDNKSATAGETKKGNLVGVSQTFGAYTAKASYGKTNTDVKAYNVGLDYALSKRTAVGVAYRNVDKADNTQDVKQVGLGLTHLF